MEAAAIVGLVLGFLPAAIITLVRVKVLVIVLGVVLFLWLLEQPAMAWLFFASLALNVVVLIPIWVVSYLAAVRAPELWGPAEAPVLVFSTAFVVPTALFYFLWRRG